MAVKHHARANERLEAATLPAAPAALPPSLPPPPQPQARGTPPRQEMQAGMQAAMQAEVLALQREVQRLRREALEQRQRQPPPPQQQQPHMRVPPPPQPEQQLEGEVEVTRHVRASLHRRVRGASCGDELRLQDPRPHSSGARAGVGEGAGGGAGGAGAGGGGEGGRAVLRQLTAASASAAMGAATARLEEAVAAAQRLRAEVPRLQAGPHGAGPRRAWEGHAAEEEGPAKSRRDPGLRPHSQSAAPPPSLPPRAASGERSKEADAVARRLDALDDDVRAEGEQVLDQLVHGMLAMPCIRARLDQVYGRATQTGPDVPPRDAFM